MEFCRDSSRRPPLIPLKPEANIATHSPILPAISSRSAAGRAHSVAGGRHPVRRSLGIGGSAFRPVLLFLLGLTLFASSSFAQVDVTASAGTANESYTTVKEAFDAINTGKHQGTITIDISGNTTESAAAVLNASGAGSASYAAITIKPAPGNSPVITGPSASALIVLNGADFVTIDGSNAGTSSRDLTITNTDPGASSAVVWLQTTAGANAATNNTIKNVNLVGNSNTTTLFGVGSGSSTISLSSLGTGNNTNTIQNNNISKVQYGIFSQGASAASKNTGNVISRNLMNTASPNNVAKGGIMVGFEDGITISQNSVEGVLQTSSPDVFGISLGLQDISTSTFTGNEVTNATVTQNHIGTVRHTGTFSACGLGVAPADTGTNHFSNNAIAGVFANGVSGDFGVGLLIGGGAGSTQIFFNSVSMSTPAGAPTDGSDKSYALAIGGSNPILDIRDNIFANTQSAGTTVNYAVGLGYSTFSNLTSDFNDLFVTNDATHFVGATGSLSSPTNRTFTAYQSTTGKDAGSISVDPQFTSTDEPSAAADLAGPGCRHLSGHHPDVLC